MNKKATEIILFKKVLWLQKIWPRYSAAERTAQSQLYLRNAVLAFNCMTSSAPTYLSSEFLTRGEVSDRINRSPKLLQIPLFKSRSGQRTFYLTYSKPVKQFGQIL